MYQKAFEMLKYLSINSKILKYPEFEKDFEMQTDASGFAIGEVLIQVGRSIAFESKKLVDSQLKWPTHEKKLFAMVHWLKIWRHYLKGQETKVFTDNVSLKYFETKTQVISKDLRWYDVIAAMNVVLILKPGRENFVPDVVRKRNS